MPFSSPPQSAVKIYVRGYVSAELTRSSSQSIAVATRLFQELCFALKRCASWRTISKFIWDYLNSDIWRNLTKGSLRGLLVSFKHPIKSLLAGTHTKLQFIQAVRRGDKDATLKLILTAVSFTVGAYVGIGFPDIDLHGPLGIGGHRSILTHSALPMFTVELIRLLLLRAGKTLIEHLPENHHPAWDSIAKGTSVLLNGLTRGFQSGVAAHLLQDSFIDGSQNLRWTDGSSLVSKHQIVSATKNPFYHREVTLSDIFMTTNAGASLLSGNTFHKARKSSS